MGCHYKHLNIHERENLLLLLGEGKTVCCNIYIYIDKLRRPKGSVKEERSERDVHIFRRNSV